MDGPGTMEKDMSAVTIPSKPNSRLQKYRLTAKGEQLLAGRVMPSQAVIRRPFLPPPAPFHNLRAEYNHEVEKKIERRDPDLAAPPGRVPVRQRDAKPFGPLAPERRARARPPFRKTRR